MISIIIIIIIIVIFIIIIIITIIIIIIILVALGPTYRYAIRTYQDTHVSNTRVCVSRITVLWVGNPSKYKAICY